MSGYDDDKDRFTNIWRQLQRPRLRSFPIAAPPPRKAEPVYIRPQEPWPTPKERTDKVFAKSCTQCNWRETHAGTTTEPASNFGKVMIAGSMLMPLAEAAIATALNAEFGLGRVAGGGILQNRHTWMIRGAGGVAGVFVLGMLPTQMADGTLHTDDQLRRMTRVATRVRFQFRKDPLGELQVYGIHTKANGDDTVRTLQAQWNADRTAIEATYDDITLIFTPRDGKLGSIKPLIYPVDDGAQLGTILVHPIPEGTDSHIEGLPGDDVTTGDCIIVFPADTGMRSMYVVFSRPINGDHAYHQPPKNLTAFPDANSVRFKGKVRGGGAARSRWKDNKGRIYEWDSQHGAVELYDKQGKHLGEFDPITGEQTKPAKPGRRVEK